MKSLNAVIRASKDRRERAAVSERGRLRAIGAEFLAFAEDERKTQPRRLAIARVRWPHRVRWCPGCLATSVAGDGVCPQCVELVGQTLMKAGEPQERAS